MKAEYINPFIDSLGSVFKTMLEMSVHRQSARLGTEEFAGEGDMVTSMIAINGVASGVIGLSFPLPTACAVAQRFSGTEFAEVTGEVTDALSELVNMVAGAAKAQLDVQPVPKLGLPSVVAGGHYKIRFPTKTVWVELPFTSDAGDFTMKISFSKSEMPAGYAAVSTRA